MKYYEIQDLSIKMKNLKADVTEDERKVIIVALRLFAMIKLLEGE